jgi:hypothetical protein
LSGLGAAEGFHDWDFWLGSWRVCDAAGTFQGVNEIVVAPGGCGLIEHWRGASGVVGASFNAYDPVRGTWTQLWAAPGSVVRLEGRLDAQGAMRTEGTISDTAALVERPFRGVWTPNPDGSVTQAFFEQDPGSGAWSTWFSGVYRRP